MSERIVFMGSPDFALASLERLIGNYPVVGVVTQPDRPSGRGQGLKPPPVKELAQSAGIDVIQPNRLRDDGVFEKLQSWKPDAIVVVAFGQILRQNVLDLPRFGCINVHGSLLPRWRGAAPIQAAILAGDVFTGVTIMKMNAGVDTGPILAKIRMDINLDETAGKLGSRLSVYGAALLLETLPLYFEGKIQPQPQIPDDATRAVMIHKDDGQLDFSQTAQALVRKVRAYQPWPGTFTMWQGHLLKVLSADILPATHVSPGQRGVVEGKPALGTAEGWLLLKEVQPAGKKSMTGEAFLAGARKWLESEV